MRRFFKKRRNKYGNNYGNSYRKSSGFRNPLYKRVGKTPIWLWLLLAVVAFVFIKPFRSFATNLFNKK